MGKRMNDNGADAALEYWTDANKLVLCSAEPTTFTEANATYALADVAVDSGDFTKANGDTSGRKVTMAAQTGILIDISGTITHAALVKTSDSTLRYVFTTGSQAVTANGSNTCNTNAVDIEIADPV